MDPPSVSTEAEVVRGSLEGQGESPVDRVRREEDELEGQVGRITSGTLEPCIQMASENLLCLRH